MLNNLDKRMNEESRTADP